MTDVYAAMEVIVRELRSTVTELCAVLHVSRSAYYAWKEGTPSPRRRRDAELIPVVHEVFWHHRRRYGSRRIAATLADQGWSCGRHRVAKLLKNQGLCAVQPKSFVPTTTDSRHGLGYSPNLLINAAEPTTINQLWVGDITYIRLRNQRFIYLAMLMDRYSRNIVGWALADTLTEPLVLQALRRALRERQPPVNLIHHTDRGGQYAGTAYRAVLRRAGLRQSMSRAGNCYDNAFMESCFGTLKTELPMADYDNQHEVRAALAAYIGYYQTERKHSALGYRSPRQFEALATTRAANI